MELNGDLAVLFMVALGAFFVWVNRVLANFEDWVEWMERKG